jgi:hypothetical protein
MGGVSVTRYQRKPETVKREGGLQAARYEAGQPLDDLLRVARMADGKAELAEVTSLPSGPVLLVRYMRCYDDHPAELDWEVVQPGEFLTYSETYGSLGADTERELAYWYEPVEP